MSQDHVDPREVKRLVGGLRVVYAGLVRIPPLAALAIGVMLGTGPADEAFAQETTRALARDWFEVEGRTRTYSLYVPPMPPPAPPVLLVLHGSGGDGDRVRALTAGLAEEEADRLGFVVVYPDGVDGSWNDCHRSAPYTANTENIDDVRFLRSLVSRLVDSHGIDPSRVWTFGFSNGGHLALRLALEAPDDFPAVAAIAASLPTEDELDCTASRRPVSVMFVNGTADPISPFQGGEVRTGSAGRIGVVRSSIGSARYFADLIEAPPQPEVTLASSSEGSRIEIARWRGDAGREVVHVTVHEGGHTIPGSPAAFPMEVGAVDRGFDALAAAIDFFAAVGH